LGAARPQVRITTLTEELQVSIHNLFKALTTSFARRPLARRNPPTCRPAVEPLEDRWVPSFSPHVDYSVNGLPGALTAVDLNGDGRVDLGPVGSGGTPGINALFGNGDGTFHNAQIPGVGTYNSPIVSDLNGDGIDDLVKINISTYDIRAQTGYGDGTYQHTQTIVLPSQLPPGVGLHASQVPATMTLGDLNADGKLDLVATGSDEEVIDDYGTTRADQYVNVLLGNGDGTFGPISVYYVRSTVSYYSQADTCILPVRDYNADGKPDVLTTGDAVRLFSGTDDGTLQTPPSLSAGAWTTDVNADGVPDRVDLDYQVDYDGQGPGSTGRYAHVSLGNGDGSFAPPVTLDLGSAFYARALGQNGLIDLDGDGLPELVTFESPFSGPSSFICVAHNDGNWAPPPPPPPPSITIGDATVAEGNTGTKAAPFTVTLSAASSQPVTVDYATADGTATAGSDYQAASGTLTFAPGETGKTVAVQVLGDRLPEPNETFVVNLSSPTSATIADGQGTGTILDDEPRISISDVSKKEGKKGQTTLFTFTVTLSAAYDQPVTMSFKTTDGTAKTGDQDYVAKTGMLTFAPGETTKTITITVNGDGKREADETFSLDLFGNSSNSLFTKSHGTGTILNDD
jgi:hypothetical protein